MEGAEKESVRVRLRERPAPGQGPVDAVLQERTATNPCYARPVTSAASLFSMCTVFVCMYLAGSCAAGSWRAATACWASSWCSR